VSRGPVLAKPFFQRPGLITPVLGPRSIQHFNDTSPAPPKTKSKSKSATKTKSKSTRCHYSSVAGTLRDPTALGCRSACFETSKYCMMPQEQWPSYTLHPAPFFTYKHTRSQCASNRRSTYHHEEKTKSSHCGLRVPARVLGFQKKGGTFCCDFTLFCKV
jgi:hypothetical protein